MAKKIASEAMADAIYMREHLNKKQFAIARQIARQKAFARQPEQGVEIQPQPVQMPRQRHSWMRAGEEDVTLGGDERW